MISPHTAMMFKALTSKITVDIINALVKCEVLKKADFKSMLELEDSLIDYHLQKLLELHMVEKAYSKYDMEIFQGYKLTKKAYKIIVELNTFKLEASKIGN